MPTFNWVFESKPIPSGILTQQNRYKRAESNMLADEKGLKQGYIGSCQVVHLHYKFIIGIMPTIQSSRAGYI